MIEDFHLDPSSQIWQHTFQPSNVCYESQGRSGEFWWKMKSSGNGKWWENQGKSHKSGLIVDVGLNKLWLHGCEAVMGVQKKTGSVTGDGIRQRSGCSLWCNLLDICTLMTENTHTHTGCCPCLGDADLLLMRLNEAWIWMEVRAWQVASQAGDWVQNYFNCCQSVLQAANYLVNQLRFGSSCGNE